MPKVKTKIELIEKEVLEIIAEKYNLNPETSTINVYKYDGGNDPREHSYTIITVEGEQAWMK